MDENICLNKLDGLTPVVSNHPHANSTNLQNQPHCDELDIGFKVSKLKLPSFTGFCKAMQWFGDWRLGKFGHCPKLGGGGMAMSEVFSKGSHKKNIEYICDHDHNSSDPPPPPHTFFAEL